MSTFLDIVDTSQGLLTSHTMAWPGNTFGTHISESFVGLEVIVGNADGDSLTSSLVDNEDVWIDLCCTKLARRGTAWKAGRLNRIIADFVESVMRRTDNET